MRSIAGPRLAGSEDEISRLSREASLHPRPDVVMPMCSGPSEYVERSVKEQRSGASVTLTGIRIRLQSWDMRVSD